MLTIRSTLAKTAFDYVDLDVSWRYKYILLKFVQKYCAEILSVDLLLMYLRRGKFLTFNILGTKQNVLLEMQL